MDIDLADVTIHIDETLNLEQLEKLEHSFRQREGVISVHFNPDKPHLIVLEYNPKRIHSRDLLDILRYQELHGELVGF